MRIIHIDKQSVTPIYKQIVAAVEEAIVRKKWRKHDRLPSVNKVCLENGVSRDTVLTAYEILKKQGVIYAHLGKGYFVKSEDLSYTQRYFLLFDELNAFKEDIYNAFLEALGSKAQVDIFFHHFNLGLFRKMIDDAAGSYSKYILMPSNMEGVEEIIAQLPRQDVLILDQTRPSLQQYPSIYQNFVRAMYSALTLAASRLEPYTQLVLLFPGQKEPLGMVTGFEQFCRDFGKRYTIQSHFELSQLERGTVFVIPDDRDLVRVVEKSQEYGLEIGSDVGIISYNDTPLKKVVARGITTISTDFTAMGKRLAAWVNTQDFIQEENPSRLLLRQSL